MGLGWLRQADGPLRLACAAIVGACTRGPSSTAGQPHAHGETTSISTETSHTGGDATTNDTTGDGIAFVDDPDFGDGPILGCNLLTQNCPSGFKCSPWAAEGEGSWYDTLCTPIADEPGEPGDPCTVEGWYYSGQDDCELGALCFFVDVETLVGTCFGTCVDIEEHPTCEDPDTMCLLSDGTDVYPCFNRCDPLVQDCPEGQACLTYGNGWFCTIDHSGPAGAYGDPCVVIDDCDPGLVCLSVALVPGCSGSPFCCSEVCDLTDPQCTGAVDGQTCQPWWEPGTAPPGEENLGVCALPP